MHEELNNIVTGFGDCPEISTLADFESFKATISGPNGSLTKVMKMGDVAKKDKPAMGKLINETKDVVNTLFDAVLERIEKADLASKIGPSIDPTLPVPDSSRGTLHPIFRYVTKWLIFSTDWFFRAEATSETEHFCLMHLIFRLIILRVICRILLSAG